MDSTKLCQTSTGQEDDWKQLYETAFPLDERTPVDDLRKLISNGSMLLHKSVNNSGELLSFSLVNLMSNFALLAYIATDTTKRSTGVGSKHMKQLIQILKTQYPTYTALFLEIESTKEPGLDAETQKMRNRRLAFYQRLGAKRLGKKYGMPSYAKKGSKAAGELLWIELTSTCVFDADLPNVIVEIFQKGYGLSSTDANVQAIITQWAATVTTAGSTCALSEDPVVATPAATSGTTSGGSTSTPEKTDTTAPVAPEETGTTASVTPEQTDTTPSVTPETTDSALVTGTTEVAAPVTGTTEVAEEIVVTPVVPPKDKDPVPTA